MNAHGEFLLVQYFWSFDQNFVIIWQHHAMQSLATSASSEGAQGIFSKITLNFSLNLSPEEVCDLFKFSKNTYREFSPYANFITANFITANFITAVFQNYY